MKTKIQKSKTIFRAELNGKWVIWSSRIDRPEREPHKHLILNTKDEVEEFFKEMQKDIDAENEMANW